MQKGGAMISTYRKFIRLLQLEVESLHDEIEIILSSLDRRLADHEITDYVRNENCAILRNELLGLEDFLRSTFMTDGRAALRDAGTLNDASLDAASLDEASVDEVAERVRGYLRRRLAERDYVPALYALIDRRIDKIVAYLKTPERVAPS